MVDIAVNRFGLGNIPNAELILTKEGCDIVRATWPEGTCNPAQVDNASAYKLEKIDVLTRIGPQFLLTAPGGINDKSKPRFTLSSEHVLSWSRVLEPKRAEAQCEIKKNPETVPVNAPLKV